MAGGPPARPTVPTPLVTVAGWAWRLILIGIVVYGAVRVLALLWVVIVPIVLAVLLAALLQPVMRLLRRVAPGWVPRSVLALLCLLLALVVLGGVGYLVGARVSAQIPVLVRDVGQTLAKLHGLVAGGFGQQVLERGQQLALDWVNRQRGQIAGYLTAGAGYLFEALTITVLTLFVAFFLLFEGDRIWGWLLSLLPGPAHERSRRAGQITWTTLTGYVHGTAIIATIHGLVIGLVVFLLGVPLAAPLGVLVFLGSFIPIAGILVAGAISVLVALGTQGWVAAVILLAVLIGEDQLEANVLQPVIMRRYVQLHPLAIVLVLTVGTVLGGIIGAIVAVPVAAIIYRAGPALLGRELPMPAPRRRDRAPRERSPRLRLRLPSRTR
jgi:predicted PurR-regulated permease PerM